MIRSHPPAETQPSPPSSSSPTAADTSTFSSPLAVRSTYTPYDDMDEVSTMPSSSSKIKEEAAKGKGKRKFVPKGKYSDDQVDDGEKENDDLEGASQNVGDSDIYMFDMLDVSSTRALYDTVTFLTTPPSSSLTSLCDLLSDKANDVVNAGLLPTVLGHIYNYDRDRGGEDFLCLCCLLAIVRIQGGWRVVRKGKGWKWLKGVMERARIEGEKEVKKEVETTAAPPPPLIANSDPTKRGRSKKRRMKPTSSSTTSTTPASSDPTVPKCISKLYPSLPSSPTTTFLALFAVKVLMSGADETQAQAEGEIDEEPEGNELYANLQLRSSGLLGAIVDTFTRTMSEYTSPSPPSSSPSKASEVKQSLSILDDGCCLSPLNVSIVGPGVFSVISVLSHSTDVDDTDVGDAAFRCVTTLTHGNGDMAREMAEVREGAERTPMEVLVEACFKVMGRFGEDRKGRNDSVVFAMNALSNVLECNPGEGVGILNKGKERRGVEWISEFVRDEVVGEGLWDLIEGRKEGGDVGEETEERLVLGGNGCVLLGIIRRWMDGVVQKEEDGPDARGDVKMGLTRDQLYKTLQSFANLMESRIGMVSLGMFNPVIQLINDIKLPPILTVEGKVEVKTEEGGGKEEGGENNVKEEELWRSVEAKIEGNNEGQEWLN